MKIQDKRVPMRRCIGCMESKPQSDMVRFTLQDDETIIRDEKRRENGRGVYLCKNTECISKARKSKAFNRSFKKNLDHDMTEKLFDELLEDFKEVTNDEKNR